MGQGRSRVGAPRQVRTLLVVDRSRTDPRALRRTRVRADPKSRSVERRAPRQSRDAHRRPIECVNELPRVPRKPGLRATRGEVALRTKAGLGCVTTETYSCNPTGVEASAAASGTATLPRFRACGSLASARAGGSGPCFWRGRGTPALAHRSRGAHLLVCGNAIGMPTEPVVVIKHEGERQTSLGGEPQLA
jgi:hypothetical protein